MDFQKFPLVEMRERVTVDGEPFMARVADFGIIWCGGHSPCFRVGNPVVVRRDIGVITNIVARTDWTEIFWQRKVVMGK